MRRFLITALAAALAGFFLMFASPSANAFGSEVLGCGFAPNYTWAANQCAGNDGNYYVRFSPHYLSGTYSYQWSITDGYGAPITRFCTGLPATDQGCLSSGCTTTSSTCTIVVEDQADTLVYTASLKLTQSGQSRTIQAAATGRPWKDCRC
jgi:hypothetical protein